MNAFNNLLYINPNDTNIFKNLLEATTHHKWQFTLFARNRIKELFKSEVHLKYFQSALENLPPEQKRNLQKLLDTRK
jgi:aminopeptidase N